jgi:hypothetical protein
VTHVEAVANAFVVDSNEKYREGSDILVEIGRKKAKVSALFDPIKKAMNGALAIVRGQESDLSGPVDRARATLEPKLIGWKRQQDEIAAAERRRLEDEARRIAESKRKKEIESLKNEGMKEVAKDLARTPVVVPAVHVESVPKVEGVSTSKRYKAEVVDLMALVKAIAAGKQPLYLVEPVMPALNQIASRGKEKMDVPGVKAVLVEKMSVRSKQENSW